jgi:hypothetical protein
MPDYGYLHLGRVLRQNATTGGYDLESVGLARTSKWGPVPSCVPGLQAGDRVILGAKGTSRDDLIILAKVGASFPDISDIGGLLDALAAKANQADLDALSTAVSGNSSSIIQLDDWLTNLQTTQQQQEDEIEALQAWEPFSRSPDFDIYNDLISTCPRWAVTTTTNITNGQAVYMRMEIMRDASISIVKFCFAPSGAPTAGTIAVALFAGADISALPRVATGTVPRQNGRYDWTFPATTIPAGSTVVVGILATGMGSSESIKLLTTPITSTSQLLNQDGSIMSTVVKNGQTALPTTLKFNALTDFDIQGTALTWVALGGQAA